MTLYHVDWQIRWLVIKKRINDPYHFKYNNPSNLSAVGVRLVVNPDPSSTTVSVIEISPKWPSSAFSNWPTPEFPGFSWSIVHIVYIKSIVEFCKFGVVSPILFTKLITSLIRIDIISSHWRRNCENTSCPAIVKSSVWVFIWYT